MKADALTPRELFDGKVQFEIPSFQRPYVWNEEDQWAPLWTDVERVANALIAAGHEADAVSAHFLGAIVLKELTAHAGDVTRHAVIDGQQRMTTIQVMLDAAHAAVAGLHYEDEAEALEELILNSSRRFAGTKDRFKLWPSRSDREAFEAAMDDQQTALPEHRISEAHAFFAGEISDWIERGSEIGSPEASPEQRARALTEVLQLRLRLVAINLGAEDDDQVIFETLNDRGTPLLAADLIKNWVFQRGEEVGADTEIWADEHWAELDEDWWREEITQGRLSRARVDIFLQYWLTMRLKDEIASDGIFRRFREHAKPQMNTAADATEFLEAMRRDADTFRSLADLEAETPAGKFYSRVIESFELAATTPLLLWMLSENHRVPDSQVEVGLGALESWVLRRTLLRMTMKDVNKLMVAALNVLEGQSVGIAGDSLRDYLAGQTADARLWPTDREMFAQLPGMRLYGNVRQGRLRVVLAEVEDRMRDERNEAVSLPQHLEIEHVMPRSWTTYWNTEPPLPPDDADARSKRVDTLGNLTLVTSKLNKSLSHRPWTDEETREEVGTGGQQPGLGKRALLSRYSLLALNKTLIDEHPERWTDGDIEKRSQELTERICEAWPRADGRQPEQSA